MVMIIYQLNMYKKNFFNKQKNKLINWTRTIKLKKIK